MIEKCTLVEPFLCNEEDTINNVAKKLDEFGQRHIYVADKEGRPVGLLSVSDIMKKVVVGGRNSAEIKVKDIMNKNVFPFDDSESVKDAYKKMVEENYISVPITEKGKFVGILTLKEAVKFITDPKNM